MAAVESIYNLIPREEEVVPKPPRYVSKHAAAAREEMKAVKEEGRFMGPAHPSDKSPQNFQKAHVGGAGATIRHPPQKREHVITKPPVPSKSEKPVMSLKSDKDFVHTNALEATTKAPPKHKAKMQLIASGRGGLVDPENAGLVPKFTAKKEYGKVPAYLIRRQEEEAQAKAEYDQYLKQLEKEGADYEVSTEERQALLQGLKDNMANLQREYLGLSMVADTASKKARKKQMEDQLSQLEADIAKIEAHPVILVRK